MSQSRWNLAHAALCLITGAWSVLASSLWPLALTGGASLLFFFITARTPQRRLAGLGVANALTLLRLLLLVGTATSFPSAWGFALVLVLDGVDGFIARKLDESSAFGAHFDMETDTLFFGLMSVALAPVAPWVLLAGALRPVYVIARAFLVETPVERRLPFARYAFGVSAWLTVACVAPIDGALRTGLSIIATSVLTLSFAESFRTLRRHAHAIPTEPVSRVEEDGR